MKMITFDIALRSLIYRLNRSGPRPTLGELYMLQVEDEILHYVINIHILVSIN